MEKKTKTKNTAAKKKTKAESKLAPGEDWVWWGRIDHKNAKEIFQRKKDEGTPYVFTINEALALGLAQLKKGG